MGEFFDLPRDQTCRHPEHEPPGGLYISPGKGYRHVCPACGTTRTIIPNQLSLNAHELAQKGQP